MTESPPKSVFSRPPDDEAELDAWADSFAAALLDVDDNDRASPPDGRTDGDP